MQLPRPAFAPDPKQFGKGRTYVSASEPAAPSITISDDVKLFALAFLAGFAFVSILIG
jgi:hypothetical protein